MKSRYQGGLLAAALLLFPFAAQAQACQPWPVESVYDGDTLRATVAGQSTRVRVMGLDTPELPPRSRCEAEKRLGYEARDRLRELLADAGEVTFCPDGLDRYGRTLATVMLDGQNVAAILIGEGLAREYHGGRRAGWCE